MKPTPTSNFSIWAYPASLDENGSPPELFEGAYGAVLNNTVTVTFVPEYPRAAGGRPAIVVPDYAAMIPELAWVADHVPRIGRRVSDLSDLRLVRLLVDEIIPSDAFAAGDRYWLSEPT